jgi:hypothetical protein
MSSCLVDACGGYVISVGAKTVRPAVVEENPFVVGIRLGSAWDSMPRDDGMGTMIAGGPCCELAKALFVATVHFGSEGA